jgi:hypothetical protein
MGKYGIFLKRHLITAHICVWYIWSFQLDHFYFYFFGGVNFMYCTTMFSYKFLNFWQLFIFGLNINVFGNRK